MRWLVLTGLLAFLSWGFDMADEYFNDPVEYAADPAYPVSAYDEDNGRFVVVYGNDDLTYEWATARIGIVASDGSVSFGDPVEFDTSGNCRYFRVAFANGKVVIAYMDTTGAEKIVIGTVSGDTITFGSLTSYPLQMGLYYGGIVYDSANDKVVCVSTWSDGLWCVVGTISGNSISFGTPVLISDDGGSYYNSNCIYEPESGKVIVTATHYISSQTLGKIMVGTVLGDTISFGTAVQFGSNAVVMDARSPLCVLPGATVVIAYRVNASGPDYMYLFVGEVSGTTISGVSTLVMPEYQYSGLDNSLAYDPVRDLVFIAFRNGDLAVWTLTVAAISISNKIPSVDLVYHRSPGLSTSPLQIFNDTVTKGFVLVYADYGTTGKGFAETFLTDGPPSFWTLFSDQMELFE